MDDPFFSRAIAELTWLHGARASLFGGGSSFGAMIERAQTFSVDKSEWDRPREITARPTSSSRPPGKSFEPDLDSIQLLRHALRRLRQAEAREPTLPVAEIIDSYFGAAGDVLARTSGGRLAALLPFVPAGKRLLDAQRARQRRSRASEVGGVQTVENACESDPKGLLRVALSEAQTLIERVLRAYDPKIPVAEAAE